MSTAAEKSLTHGFLSQQYTTDEGGMATDMHCPTCGEEISGSYLAFFQCPHCETMIFRDEDGNLINLEQEHTCPECGHSFNDMTDETQKKFSLAYLKLEQTMDEIFLEHECSIKQILSKIKHLQSE